MRLNNTKCKICVRIKVVVRHIPLIQREYSADQNARGMKSTPNSIRASKYESINKFAKFLWTIPATMLEAIVPWSQMNSTPLSASGQSTSSLCDLRSILFYSFSGVEYIYSLWHIFVNSLTWHMQFCLKCSRYCQVFVKVVLAYFQIYFFTKGSINTLTTLN